LTVLQRQTHTTALDGIAWDKHRSDRSCFSIGLSHPCPLGCGPRSPKYRGGPTLNQRRLARTPPERHARGVAPPTHPPTPSAPSIKDRLDERVVGQDEAKIQLAQLIAMHLNWCHKPLDALLPPNGLLIGPTGVGKTHTIRTACALLDLPFVVADATSLVPSGIVGEQIEDILERLVESARQLRLSRGEPVDLDVPIDRADLDLARTGVIFIDEFDKLASSEAAGYEEPIRLTVQRRLLKLIEGSLLRVGVKRHGTDHPDHYINTMGILIIGSGAFTGIDTPAIRSRRAPNMLADLVDPLEVVSTDLVQYGFIPELIARMPVLIQYRPLEKQDFVEILKGEFSPIRLWQRYCAAFDMDFADPEPAVLQLIAEQAVRLNMGARGLQQLLFQRLPAEIFEFERSGQKTYHLTAERWRHPRRSRSKG